LKPRRLERSGTGTISLNPPQAGRGVETLKNDIILRAFNPPQTVRGIETLIL
jgi:hypothetical protein